MSEPTIKTNSDPMVAQSYTIPLSVLTRFSTKYGKGERSKVVARLISEHLAGEP